MKLAIPIALILAGLVGLIVMGVLQHGIPELQASELVAGGYADQVVKVHGKLHAIQSDKRPLRFTVEDRNDPTVTFEVWADQTRPDTFQLTYDVAVEGKFDPAKGVFTADRIYTKCPSKYEAADKLKVQAGEVPPAPGERLERN